MHFLDAVRWRIRRFRIWFLNLFDPHRDEFEKPEDPLIRELRVRIVYAEQLYEKERRRNLKLNRMIHRRYGLTNAYGEFDGSKKEHSVKPIPSNYVPLHVRRRQAEKEQEKNKALAEERQRLSSNWGKKISALEKETGLAEVVSGDIRNSDDESAADLEFLRSDSN